MSKNVGYLNFYPLGIDWIVTMTGEQGRFLQGSSKIID